MAGDADTVPYLYYGGHQPAHTLARWDLQLDVPFSSYKDSSPGVEA
tara:strand:+ start:806 stop:943 length:138 start_codon:yes stop_codon:yes gene_type:complete